MILLGFFLLLFNDSIRFLVIFKFWLFSYILNIIFNIKLPSYGYKKYYKWMIVSQLQCIQNVCRFIFCLKYIYKFLLFFYIYFKFWELYSIEYYTLCVFFCSQMHTHTLYSYINTCMSKPGSAYVKSVHIANHALGVIIHFSQYPANTTIKTTKNKIWIICRKNATKKEQIKNMRNNS